MKGDCAKHSGRMLDVCNDRTLRADPLFGAAHLVLAVWQCQRMHPMQRKARKKRIAMQRLLVLTRNVLLHSRAFCQSDVAWSEGVVHMQGRCDLLSHKPILRARHPPVEFGQKKNVCRTQQRMLAQALNDAVETDSTLDIPCDRGHIFRSDV